ncbi:MAG TPA: 3'-5' exonuclease, partial [Candidatus Cybelea sp.]|nr:3'-5' exonuclease [Candidatus Cybelea sp.]
ASGLIAKNEGRLGKTLWTDIADGEMVTMRGVWDGPEEARAVGEQIEALQRAKEPLSGMAILVRAGFQTREFEERFITLGLPYRVIGGLRFYERAEIRDALAYLRVVVQPDDDLAFERIVNVPKRGLGEATLQALHRAARAGNSSLVRAAETIVATDELKAKPRSALRDLLNGFARWRSLLDGMPHTELAETVLDESGYTAMWQQDKSVEAPGRLENLKELIRALEQFENLSGFLEHVALVMENEDSERDDMVNLMTLHAAKGLEFDTVFLPGWEEGLFPHQRALEEGGTAGLEEERRLAYVGITRARRRCLISFAANRRVYNQWQSSVPSRFIDELPPEHVARDADQGLYGYGGLGGTGHGGFVYDAPWLQAEQRLLQRGYRVGGGRTIDGTAKRIEDASPSGGWQVGARVFHQKFGYGRILHVENDRLEIDFEKSGRKKVIGGFVEPA